MPKSSSPRRRDIRAVYTLVGECRDFGDDPTGWRRHLFAGLGRLVDAPVVFGGEMGIGGGRPRDLGTTDWGWENGFDRTGWAYALAQFARDPGYSPLMTGLAARAAPEGWVSVPRRAVLTDDAWYRSGYFAAVHRTMGTDAVLFSFGPVAAAAGEFNGVILNRAAGRPDFTGADRALVREAQALVGPLVGGPLARFADPAPSALSPRVRQVLKCLLEGDTDKQVAARLSLSPHTVNQYTKQVYRHFGVTARAELLARWVKRGWGGRCAWADDRTGAS